MGQIRYGRRSQKSLAKAKALYKRCAQEIEQQGYTTIFVDLPGRLDYLVLDRLNRRFIGALNLKSVEWGDAGARMLKWVIYTREASVEEVMRGGFGASERRQQLLADGYELVAEDDTCDLYPILPNSRQVFVRPRSSD